MVAGAFFVCGVKRNGSLPCGDDKRGRDHKRGWVLSILWWFFMGGRLANCLIGLILTGYGKEQIAFKLA